MARFLFTNLFYVYDISDENIYEFVRTKIERHFSWLLTERHDIYLSGVGKKWRGWRKKGCIVSHAGFRSTPFFLLNVFLAWLTHFIDAFWMVTKGPFVAVAPTPESGLAVALVKAIFRNKVRLVLRVQVYTASRAFYVKKSRWWFRIIKRIERFVLCRADLVIPISKFMYNLVISQGVRPDKVIILPLPVFWFKDAEITDLPAANRILFVGRLEKEKGLHVLLQAVVIARKEVPDIHLLIAGEGTYRPVLEQIVGSLGIYEHASFLGWIKTYDLKNLYKEAYTLILPSIWQEGLGMVLVEAGLMGRPVVASNIGGIRDIVQHGENGLLVSPGDAKALADAIVTVLKDRVLAQRMGIAGARIAREYLQKRTEAMGYVHKAIYELIGDGSK